MRLPGSQVWDLLFRILKLCWRFFAFLIAPLSSRYLATSADWPRTPMMASSSFSWCPSCLSASYLPSVLAATDCFANSLRQTWNGKAFACEAVLESSEQFSGSLSSVR